MIYDSDAYQQAALRTERTDEEFMEAVRQRICTYYSNVETLLRQMQQLGRSMDKIKKHCIYGKEVPELSDPTLFGFARGPRLNTAKLRHLHGLIGMITEVGELAEEFLKAGDGPNDRLNIKEELGDLAWYKAISADALGLHSSEILRANEAKLRARYPQGFNLQDCMVRNLDAEKKALGE